MEIKVSTTNSKLGIIPSINLPPIITCRDNCPCKNECYALKGRFRFPNVKKSLIQNLKVYSENSKNYFTQVKNYISNGLITYNYFRWHASGDIIDFDYFYNMVEIAKQLPNTKFLAFTKKYELVNNFIKENGALPSNLNIVLSAWGDDFILNNEYDLPVAHVRFNDKSNDNIPDTALKCSGDCTNCLQCWNIRQGQHVVFDKH